MTTPDPDALEALKEATRGAHEAIKDLRAATKEAREVVEQVHVAARKDVDDRIEEALKAGLEELSNAISDAIEVSTDKVFKRFDAIQATLLGETKKDRRAGRPSIPELIDPSSTKYDNGEKL